MNITSATFVAGLQGTSSFLEDGTPQVAIIGRSNVGKSSLINTLTGVKDLARTSAFPGRTQEINLFLINKALYLVDLPGYGFARASHAIRNRLQELIDWYFFAAPCTQKVVILVIDAQIGITDSDAEMIQLLTSRNKRVVIVANKIDKLKRSESQAQLKRIADDAAGHTVIPFSSVDAIGVRELTQVILGPSYVM